MAQISALRLTIPAEFFHVFPIPSKQGRNRSNEVRPLPFQFIFY